MKAPCFILLASILPTIAFNADIRADSNRDGVVDLASTSDLLDKHSSTDEAGAVFLANIGDTGGRCSQIATAGPALSNEELAACNDASDDVQRTPQFMAPLKTVPIDGLSPGASGTISIQDAVARAKVRIFRFEDSSWLFTDNNHTFTTSQLSMGLSLGIDARDTRRSNIWDGRVSVTFTVQDASQKSRDTVSLRVAPVLTNHHLQTPSEFFTTAGNLSVNFFQARFVSNLSRILTGHAPDIPLTQLDGTDDIWTQDFFEAGYTSLPGPSRAITLAARRTR